MAHSENKRRTTTSATASVVLPQHKKHQPQKLSSTLPTQNIKTAAINKLATKPSVKDISTYVATV